MNPKPHPLENCLSGLLISNDGLIRVLAEAVCLTDQVRLIPAEVHPHVATFGCELPLQCWDWQSRVDDQTTTGRLERRFAGRIDLCEGSLKCGKSGTPPKSNSQLGQACTCRTLTCHCVKCDQGTGESLPAAEQQRRPFWRGQDQPIAADATVLRQRGKGNRPIHAGVGRCWQRNAEDQGRTASRHRDRAGRHRARAPDLCRALVLQEMSRREQTWRQHDHLLSFQPSAQRSTGQARLADMLECERLTERQRDSRSRAHGDSRLQRHMGTTVSLLRLWRICTPSCHHRTK